MAKTADYVVKKVLDSLVVGAAEASLPAVDAQNIIDYMNDYMFSIDALGIKLGYTEVTNISQVLTVSAGAIRGIIANVAMAVAQGYDVPISQGLAMQARAGMKAMIRLSTTSKLTATAFPSTLPRGSGNQDNFDGSAFYTGPVVTT